MSILSRRRFISLCGAAAGLALSGPAWAAGPMVRRWQGVALGAQSTLVLAHPEADRLIGLARAEIERLENIFSLYRPDSELCRLNRTGRLEAPPPEMVELLSLALRVSRWTDGAFDVTVQPLWHARAAGDIGRLRQAAHLVDWRGVAVASDRVTLARPGMAITLNGIAQGFITDRVADLLRAQGVVDVLADMGEISAQGRNPDGDPWRVGVAGGGPLLRLRDRAVATSAGAPDSEPGWQRHLVDPATGRWVAPGRAASVVAKRAAVADAVSTALVARPMAAADVSRILAKLGAERAWLKADAAADWSLVLA